MNRLFREGVARVRGTASLAQATFAVHAGAFVVLAFAVVTWVPERSPRGMLAAFAATSFAMAFYTVRRGDRLTHSEVYVMTAAVMFVIGLLTRTTEVDLGALSNGAVLPMLGVYVVWFLPGSLARTLIYGGCLWWLLSAASRGEALLTSLAFSLVIQVVVASEIFAAVRARSDRQSRLDVLTGALNRRGLTEACELLLARLHEREAAFSLISIDLDGLREINNQQGHRAGDEALIEACRHWRSRLRSGDLIGRLGGDEFVIVLPGAGAIEATALKKRLRLGATVTWSAGVAQARPDDTLASLLHRADERMYRQKAQRAVS